MYGGCLLCPLYPLLILINKGNRTKWSLIRSVSHISDLRGSPICLITSIITDRIGRLEVLLPINHSYNKICDILIRLF